MTHVIAPLPGDGLRVQPMPGKSLTDQVYELLREEILRVQRRPGDLVSEVELAAQYGVSKTPIREALRLLAQDGWVIVLPRKGYLIRPLRLEDLREIFSVRLLLEPSVARQVAVEISDAQAEQLEQLVDEQAASGDDIDAALHAARRFHVALAEITGNRRLVRMLVDLLDEVRRLHFLLPNVESHITSSEELNAHRGLVEALRNGQSDKAFELMQTHVNEVARTLVQGFSGQVASP
jgi:GntR family transcriptional regulator, rspAB operon transcriptional repressor